jgi:hypothetical protein
VRQKDLPSTKVILSSQGSWNLDYLVSPNMCDDKQGFAKYFWKKLPEIHDDKSNSMLNTAELLPNIYDNHHVGSHTS